MALYSSKPVVIDQPAELLYQRLSDFSTYQERLDQIPEDVRRKVGDVRFTPDSILINAAPVGEIAFEVTERVAPSLVVLKAKNAPVDMSLRLELTPEGEEKSSVISSIDVDIPVFLRPMVGGKMQEAADKFAELLATFFGGTKA
ncbi:MAG: SRPBCC family protein [Clostridium sp.]|nr:SRPBCC family protein [Clostridium sp.]